MIKYPPTYHGYLRIQTPTPLCITSWQSAEIENCSCRTFPERTSDHKFIVINLLSACSGCTFPGFGVWGGYCTGGFCKKGPVAAPCQTQSVSASSTMDSSQDMAEPVRQVSVASEKRYSRKGKNTGQREKGKTRVRLQ